MIRRSLALFLLAAAILCMSAGCSSAPKVIAAKTSRTIVLDAESKRTPITAKVAEALTLQLPQPAQPQNQEWRLVSHDARMLHQSTGIGSAYAGGAPTVTFVTQRVVSRTSLRFLLVPKTERREAEPLDSYEVVVTIQP